MPSGGSGVPADRANWSDERALRVELAAAYRMAARLGMHEGVCNHLSVMLPGRRDRFLISPRGVHWAAMTASRLLTIDDAGETIAGEGAPIRTGVSIHTRIHRHHPCADVVFHTHMPYATTLASIRGARLEAMHQNALRFLGRCAYDEHFNGFAVDFAEGERMARRIGDNSVLFLGNHGVIVVGQSVAEAFDDLYYLERACQVQVMAMQTGRPLLTIRDDIARTAAAQLGDRAIGAAFHFEALKEVLDRDEPEYAS